MSGARRPVERPTWATVHLGAIRANFAEARRRALDIVDANHSLSLSSRSTFAAQIKSLSDKPLMACVVQLTLQLP